MNLIEMERAIIKRYRAKLYRPFVKAVNDYDLVQKGDCIGICMSGGKDSFLLAKCMQELVRHGKVPFEAYYVCMNPGYNEKNRELILSNAKKLNIPLEMFESNIFDVTPAA